MPKSKDTIEAGPVTIKQVIGPVTIKQRNHGFVAIDAMGETCGSGTDMLGLIGAVQTRYDVDVVVERYGKNLP